MGEYRQPAAGPAVNFLLIPTGIWIPFFGLANLVCVVTNLIPYPTADGGRALYFWRQMRAAGRSE